MQDFLPINKKDIQKRGWDCVDFVYVTAVLSSVINRCILISPFASYGKIPKISRYGSAFDIPRNIISADCV